MKFVEKMILVLIEIPVLIKKTFNPIKFLFKNFKKSFSYLLHRFSYCKKRVLEFKFNRGVQDILNKLSKNLLISFNKWKWVLFLVKKKKKKKKTSKPLINFAPLKRVFRYNRKFRDFVMFGVGTVFSAIFVFTPIQFYTWYKNLPDPTLLGEISRSNKSTRILDRQGRLLYEIFIDKKYDPVPLGQIPKHAVFATLAIEDHEFYDHYGFRPLSMVRAAKATVIDDNLQGGSTITQQLVKNVLLTPERTISRKLKEVMLSFLVERKYTKNELLEMYMNNIPYGGTAWGIQAAAQKFFNKNVWELDLAESSFLAGLPSAPTSYSPFTGTDDLAKYRQDLVLQRMVQLGYITNREAQEAYKEELAFAPQVEFIRAPHFVNFVRSELNKKFGKRLVDFGGLTVKTTLDLDFQTKVTEIVEEEVAANEFLNLNNGASVVIDVENRGILAYVGSVDYFKDEWGAYDVITARRQPGSTIKPLTYALALERGFTTASVIVDAPVTYQSQGSQSYSPVNYDGKFHGPVTLRHALANSYNVPAVKLAKVVGPDNIVQFGKDLGLSGWQVGNDYGLSITLGGKETRLLDLTNVFAIFSDEGVYKAPTPFISIRDVNGNELYRSTVSREVVDPKVAYLITNILSDNRARTPAFGTNHRLSIPGYTVAAKTGTTDEIRDNYTIGYTPSYVVGVWVGNNDNKPMTRGLASGLTGAAPIWNRVMTELLKGSPNENFEIPAGVVVKTDSRCGISEVFVRGTEVSKLCPEKKKDKDKDKKDKDDDDKDDDD